MMATIINIAALIIRTGWQRRKSTTTYTDKRQTTHESTSQKEFQNPEIITGLHIYVP